LVTISTLNPYSLTQIELDTLLITNQRPAITVSKIFVQLCVFVSSRLNN